MHDLAYYSKKYNLVILVDSWYLDIFCCIKIANYICNIITIELCMLIEVWKKKYIKYAKNLTWNEAKKFFKLVLYSGIILNRRQVDSIDGALKVKILRDETKKKLRWCMNVQK